MVYEIKNDKILASSKKLSKNSTGLIGIFTKEEWKAYDLVENKELEKIHFCKIEDAKQYLYGTLCIPVKSKYPTNYSVYFYILNDNLIFIDDEGKIPELIEQIINKKSKTDYNIMKLFRDILEFCIKDDLEYLEKMETKLSLLEDKVTKGRADKFSEIIIRVKKEILKFYHYYNQLLDMIDTLLDEYDGNINIEEVFNVYYQRIERLQSEALLLREYTKELQSLYESQVSLKQNDVMQILTTVTTIFLPLTLITGWYGMNFKYMPELTWEFGYPMIFILFAVIIIVCIIIFKKKKFW